MNIALRLAWVSGFFAVLVSCSTPEKKEPPKKSSPNAIQQFHKAEKLKDSNKKQSIQLLSRFVIDHPDSDLTDDAYLLLGKLYLDLSDPSNAYRQFVSALQLSLTPLRENDAKLGAGHSLFRLGRTQDALKYAKEVVNAGSDEQKARALEWGSSWLQNSADSLQYAKWLSTAAQLHPKPEGREKFSAKARELIEQKLTTGQLEDIADDSEFGMLRVPALYKLGVYTYENQDLSRSQNYFEQVVGLSNEGEWASKARDYLSRMGQRKLVNAKTIGLIIPLTGKNARIGERTLNGVQLALGLVGPQSSDFKLAIADSDGNPEVGKKSVERLVFEDNAIAIIGSVQSRDALAVAEKAHELGTPSISLSQKSKLTEVGPTVFRNAMTSEMQIKFLLDLAMQKLGMKRFAVFYPNDPYGIEFTNYFWDEVSTRGGKITAAQSYDPKETDFRKSVKKLVGTFYPEDRADELRLITKERNKKGVTKSARSAEDTEILPPVVDFDALFIPDTTRALGIIAPTLAYSDVQNIPFLGSNIWNQPDLIQRGEKFVENSVFVDSYLLQTPEFKSSSFFQQFVQAFGYEPGIFEVQAYEAALALKSVIQAGATQRSDVVRALSQMSTIQGVVGKMSLNDKREFVRPMIGLTVKKQQIVPISP